MVLTGSLKYRTNAFSMGTTCGIQINSEVNQEFQRNQKKKLNN